MLKLRKATADDFSDIKALMQLAISQLQKGFLTPEQIQASFVAMGLDTQLIDDGTYFCVPKKTVPVFALCTPIQITFGVALAR